jgi:U4/U6 small nuclear ribonucleoprotein PRP3
MGEANATGGQADKNEKKALRDRYKTMAPKFSTVRANQAAAAEAAAQQKVKEEEAAKRTIIPSLNPYASGGVLTATAAEGAGAGAAEEVRARDRRKRQLQFARPGRYVEQGDQLRNEAKMEALKARIAEASKKAGLEGEFDTLEKSLKVSRGASPAV